MFGLKRFKLKSAYNPVVRPLVQEVFAGMEKVVIQQQFTTSPSEFIVLCEIFWESKVDNPPARLKELVVKTQYFHDISVIASSGRRTLCFVHGEYTDMYKELFQFTTREFLCFLEYPAVLTKEWITIYMAGPPREVRRLLDYLADWGAEWEVISSSPYLTRDRGVLSALTNKQRDILRHAHTNGFFDRPRRRTARALAKSAGMRHTTYLTHIRKAQKRMLDGLFEGQDGP